MRRILIFCVGAVLASCGRPGASAEPAAAAEPPQVVTATPETGGSLLEAFRVSYGGPAPLVVTGDNGDELTFSPQAFVKVQPGVVALISKGEAPGACHACFGALSIRYLRPEGNTFVVLSRWDGLGGGAAYGMAAPWSIRTDIDDYPVMVLERKDGGMGCFDTRVDLVSLTPTGPLSIATDVLVEAGYDPGPGESPSKAWKIQGKIVPIERARVFAVQRTGLRTAPVMYKRVGDVFMTGDGRDVPSC